MKKKIEKLVSKHTLNLAKAKTLEEMAQCEIDFVNKLLEAINVVRSYEFLKASFKKGDVVLIDGWQERIVVQEFQNGCVELESENGCTLIGKGRLTLAPKSL